MVVRSLSLASALCFQFALVAQTLVGTSPTTRNALLEKFTAINCGNCPAAASVANDLTSQYGNDLVWISVHGGDLSTPSASQPDFRTADGSALWAQFNVFFQPQGMISRQGLSGASGWNNAIMGLLSQNSPVNIGVAAEYDPSANAILIEVEAYYTADVPAGERIHVAVTQDHIPGWQSDYVNGNHLAYDHRHVLRDLVTPVAGDPVNDVAEGVLVLRSYQIPVAASWELDDLSIVAFMTGSDGEAHQVRSVPANGGSTVAVRERDAGLGQAWPIPAYDLLFIPIERRSGDVIVVRDTQGRVVRSLPVSADPLVKLPLGGLAPGVYFYGYPGVAARRFVVERAK